MPTVVITGASKGIGRATALHLDRKGFTVLAGVRSTADGDSLCKEASPRLQPIVLDITNAAHITQAAETVRKVVGDNGLDGLVNNAGIAVAAPLEFLPIDEFRRQIEVNLTAQLAVTQALLPHIRQAKGRIINISSVGGRIAGGMLGAYHASKFALEALTDVLRQELSPWGIEVVSIEPGAIATPIWDTSTGVADRLQEQMPAQGREYYAKGIAGARHFAQQAAKIGLPPERVAEVVEQALTANRPRTRYTVGRDARIGSAILARLPDRMRDWVMARRR
jgi:NAD(P)-dependent dehydrogenase (short-subunit alcohol dehydrogenase family)